ncbi:uncharacterized protein LOC112086501 [Eutrema salsugineum]|uniref:uncharacterized protein LOC112086501 n=1 Tax=Eutrema salsugineum TaxID=72664 RepID=UPI000CED36BC|nr:uncharacterized protein LOC112086501 [Eutrema salsugineum]
MAKPTHTVPEQISQSTRFYPYFKDCIGAIDGTHIYAMVKGHEKASYRNRKRFLSQNVLATCNFDLEFMYVLSGWEGSAHDSKVLQDALTRRTNRLQVPEEDDDEETENHNSEENDDTGNVEPQDQEREYARQWRATIAADMWRDATIIGSQR